MDSNWLNLLPFVALGGLLGLIHFGGLWYTVKRLPQAKRPALWMGGSFILRSAIVVTGFYLVIQSGMPPVVAAVSGFVSVRLIFGRRLRPDRQ